MVATVPPGRRGRKVWRLGGAHERAAHDDAFAGRRDVRELLFDVALVDRAVALEDALALGSILFTYLEKASQGRH